MKPFQDGHVGVAAGVRVQAGRQIVAAGLLLAFATEARADGVANVLVNKTIAPATIALIDPESGTSTGGGTTDVRVAPGDIIIFRFEMFPAPLGQIRGLQGYLTEYIPSNTQVVGARFIDANGATVPPNPPGAAADGCARSCNGYSGLTSSTGAVNLSDGSIAQLHADTGIFYARAPAKLLRTPTNSFITLTNGTEMSPEPRNVRNVKDILGIDKNDKVFSHNQWDWVQVRAFGIPTAASGNSGWGNTPFGYGSPVAGPQTFYKYEASESAGGVVQFNNTTGPWQRIVTNGAQIGFGAAVNSGGVLKRMHQSVPANLAGFELTPDNALPTDTVALRFAMGELRVGQPIRAEVALRVLATPLDGALGKDANCAEAFGGDTSAASDGVRGKDNPWSLYIGTPACTFLNLQYELSADKSLATSGDVITYTLKGKNLSLNPQSNAQIRLRFDSNDSSYVAGSATGNPSVQSCGSMSCLVWPARTLASGEGYVYTAKFSAGGGGHVTNVMFADYESAQLPSPGYTTQALTVIRGVSLFDIAFTEPANVAPGASVTVNGTLLNKGSGEGNLTELNFILPTGWGISSATLGGQTLPCTAGKCSPANSSFQPAEMRALSLTLTAPANAASGIATIDLQTWGAQSMFGGAFESFYPGVIKIPVGAARSATPTLKCPIPDALAVVSGTTSEANGTTIQVYLNGILKGTVASGAGAFTFGNLGSMYAGEEVRVSATAVGKLPSALSAPCYVALTAPCQNLKDDDGDGLTDFPADLGCTGPDDVTEANTVYQCFDNIDNDNDGQKDYPADLSCQSATDNDESGPSACGNGVDDDGDGLIDFPSDLGCASATDSSELDLGPCQDGIDNDADGLTDFPSDPECYAAIDPDERGPQMSTMEGQPRILIAFDTSGSMNWTTCDSSFTGGDGTLACGGTDVACAACNSSGCGNGIADDSRLFKVKAGITDAVRAFGEVDFGLMRFHQRATSFACPGSNASLSSGGWQGAGAAPCSGGFSSGDLLVSFARDNRLGLLQWMDGKTNYPGTPPAGMDVELRGSGTTPLGGILAAASAQLQSVVAADLRKACRPYRVVLVTDGDETCFGNPVAQATALKNAGIAVQVIGFSTTDAAMVQTLNNIAAAGGTGTAIMVDDANELSQALATVVSDSLKAEFCNGVDDDCDGLVDEDFPDKNKACDNGASGICARPGKFICNATQTGLICDAGAGQAGTEACPPNGVDDNCNGVVDDIPGGCTQCIPEVCNAIDDDCDGQTDEATDLFPCVGGNGSCPPPCGSNIGVCSPGVLACAAGTLACTGSSAAGTEVCNGVDDNCDGVIDGFTRSCYPDAIAGCDSGAKTCKGICRLGQQQCPRLSAAAASNDYGACLGAVTPQTEVCNGLDDDCNGTVDDGIAGGCAQVCIPSTELCNGKDDDCDGVIDEDPVGQNDPCAEGIDAALVGVGVCKAGAKVCVAGALVCRGTVGPSPEICDGLDNDCDGKVDVGAAECGSDGNFACAMGSCQPTCGKGEFECPGDRVCANPQTLALCSGPDLTGCACLPSPCINAKCDPRSQVCSLASAGTARCVDRCLPGTCTPGQTCQPGTGQCLDCHSIGCAVNQACVDSPGRCVANPCAGVTCPSGQFCSQGTCQATCDSSKCAAGEICLNGACTKSACANANCDGRNICNPATGQCTPNLCTASCAKGLSCVPATGQCAVDACLTSACPSCTVCDIAFDGAVQCLPVPGCGKLVTVNASGGGCSCEVGARKEAPAGAWLLLLGVFFLIKRRRTGRAGAR